MRKRKEKTKDTKFETYINKRTSLSNSFIKNIRYKEKIWVVKKGKKETKHSFALQLFGCS